MNGIGDLRLDFLDREEVDEGDMTNEEIMLDVEGEVGDDSWDRLGCLRLLCLWINGDPLKRMSVMRPLKQTVL